MKMRKTAAAVALGSVIALAASFAHATIPDSAGVIHGCYQKNFGQLRVIDPVRESCTSSETQIQWNEQGIQGEKGDKGDKGDPGAQGPQGPSGFLGSRIVSASRQIPADTVSQVSVECADDEVMTGGGGGNDFATPATQAAQILWSGPVYVEENVAGWLLIVYNAQSTPHTVYANAICVTVR